MNAVLVMFKADGERKDLPLTKPVMILGRKHSCDLRIPLSSVSREHCQVEKRGDDLYVRDLGSSNGTFHNETRVLEAKLKAGDTLQVGPVHFTVVIDGQPDEIEPVRSVIPDEDEMAGTPPRGTPAPKKPAAKPAKPAAAKAPPADEDLEDLGELEGLEDLEELGELEDIEDLEILEDDDEDDDNYARPQTPPAQAVAPTPAPPPKPTPNAATPKPKAPAPTPGAPPDDDDPIAALEALMNGDDEDEPGVPELEDDEPITLNFDDDDDER